MTPDVLAVQEIGSTEALDDVLVRTGGDWHVELADTDGRGTGVGNASRTPLTDVHQVVDFPNKLAPIQVDDTDERIHRLVRPPLHAVVDTDPGPVHVLTCHLKSKLPTFPGCRFSPRDEHERARFAAYAPSERRSSVLS